MLRRSSVFAGGWALKAAEAVCSGNGVDEAVATHATRIFNKPGFGSRPQMAMWAKDGGLA